MRVCVHRVVQLARDYATRRTAFGKLLKDHPLHLQTLARMEVSWQQTTQPPCSVSHHASLMPSCLKVETRAALLLVMDVCRLLGREESGTATQLDANLLRLLTPVTKLYTGKQVWSVVCEHESDTSPFWWNLLLPWFGFVSDGGCGVGGFGELRRTGLHRGYWLAWAAPWCTGEFSANTGYYNIFQFPCLYVFVFQVLSIWEGTTNVLSLDVLRCVARSSGMVLHAYFTHVKVGVQWILPANKLIHWSRTVLDRDVMCALVSLFSQSLLSGASGISSLAPAVRALDRSLSDLEDFVQVAAAKAPGYLELAARDLAYSLARIYMGGKLIHIHSPSICSCIYGQERSEEILEAWLHLTPQQSKYRLRFKLLCLYK